MDRSSEIGKRGAFDQAFELATALRRLIAETKRETLGSIEALVWKRETLAGVR